MDAKMQRQDQLIGRLLAGLYNVMAGDEEHSWTEIDFIPKKEEEKKEMSDEEKLKFLSNMNLAMGGTIGRTE